MKDFQSKNKFNLLALLLTVTMCLAVGCGVGEFAGSTSKSSDPNALSGKLVITGSSTVAPLVQEIATRFESKHPGVRIDVQTGGSSRGIRDASTGAADIGMVSRDLKPEESTKLDAHVIAWDGVAFVVHGQNRIKQLTEDQLREIYTGKVKNWSQLGGDDSKIVVSNRANGRSELDLVCDFLGIKPSQIMADIIDGETQQSLKSVIGNPRVITYTSVGAAQDALQRGEPLKLLPLKGIDASSNTVKSGQFPLARPLSLLVNKNQTSGNGKAELANAFLTFAASESVADATTGLGFVPAK